MIHNNSIPRMAVTFFILVAALSTIRAQGLKVSASSLFTDHMVLQRTSRAPVWGKGIPGHTVSVRTSWGNSSSCTVGPDSTWMTRVRTPKAGGPYVLTIVDGSDSLRFNDVLIGEVWLCSGQSNMEMPLAGWPPADTILGSGDAIHHASIPHLRFFSVKREFSTRPKTTCTGSWKVCSPASVPALSATAFFFGRKLQGDLKVPVGLIVSSWGGTVVDAWTSADFLAPLPGYDSTLKTLASAEEDQRKQKAWLMSFPQLPVEDKPEPTRWEHLEFMDSLCSSRSFADSAWREMMLPGIWEKSEVGEFDGVVWFRKSVTIPASWLHRDLSLSLGAIDDMDITYVNGTRVGGYETRSAWNVDRLYTIPAALVDTTTLEIAVRVIDTYGQGGIYGSPGSMALRPAGSGELLDLSGAWKYKPVAQFDNDTFAVFGLEGDPFLNRPKVEIAYGPNMATSLYNGMIAPLIPYALSGAIWYQGEADIFRAFRYRKLFSTMIENWRHDFERPALPFYYTQIAPYDYGNRDGSAYLREAQLQALSVPHTGMAVTLDVGNPVNIHPANKRAVGERLARWALANTYGKKVAFWSPVVAGVKKRAGTIELRFDHAPGGLVLIGGMRGNNFQIAGEDRIFRPAEVTVKGATLIVSHPDIADPAAVRYAWSDTPDATLFNTDGLPASSFRTDHWSK
jgi:sialate O-acetylesterase